MLLRKVACRARILDLPVRPCRRQIWAACARMSLRLPPIKEHAMQTLEEIARQAVREFDIDYGERRAALRLV